MRATAMFEALLLLYPSAFRQEYGAEMRLVFGEQLRDVRRTRHRPGEALLWLRALRDAFTIAPTEHYNVIAQDVRYTLAAMAAQPGFAAVAILSLALGIGANTALFSLWHGVLLASLPVRAPEQLVLLTDPNVSGVSVGAETDGPRSLLTYAEYERLRDDPGGFSGVMATQSALDRWQIRIDRNWEEASGRLVSGNYFEVLGVTPLLGRGFTRDDDRIGSAPYIVLGHDYWQRRFGGDPAVIGRQITVRKLAMTVIGVAPPGFHGETSGQRPDLWMPLSAQSGVLPGRDWLHEAGTEKVMWLHVFGRLREGITIQQAEAAANAVFRATLETHYGTNLSPEVRKEFLNQRLQARPAATGASPVRERFGEPLVALLGGVGILLLITCANLANLLLARGAARQREIAVRLSLGASRARLVRQFLTESLVLALFGGGAGLGAALLLHRALTGLMAQVATTFEIGFHLDPAVLGFTFAVTFAAALAFGLLPAWLATRTDAAESLKGQTRNSSASTGQLRWGRALVAVQLALSLPLLFGAGLLLRTLLNLQSVDLGYAREGLVIARVDARSAGYEEARREPLFRGLREELLRIPGVAAATYSENGLFGGTDSGDRIEVDGYSAPDGKPYGSRWDQVGPRYFSTIGVPLAAGRDIDENDRATSPRVCVINEAFARKFFRNRNPLGQFVTTIYGDRRLRHQVVGIAKDFRTHSLRAETPTRHFVPLTQPLGEYSAAVFSVRVAGDSGRAIAAIRAAMQRLDPAMPLTVQRLDDRLSLRVAQDRVMARLGAAFAAVALLLAAIGLYGVLSYNVVRRQREIGIRIAVGAEPARVVRMVLRETGVLVAAGLAAGAGLAWAVGQLIASQLHGLAPHDPLTLGAALVLLLGVAGSAAYLPARRAARLDPMVALRQE